MVQERKMLYGLVFEIFGSKCDRKKPCVFPIFAGKKRGKIFALPSCRLFSEGTGRLWTEEKSYLQKCFEKLKSRWIGPLSHKAKKILEIASLVELIPTSQKVMIWWVELKQSSSFSVELCTTTPILVGLSQTIQKRLVELIPTSQKVRIWWVELKQSSSFSVELCTTTPILVGLSQTIQKNW